MTEFSRSLHTCLLSATGSAVSKTILNEKDVLVPADYNWFVYQARTPISFHLPASRVAVKSSHGFSLYHGTIFGISIRRTNRKVDNIRLPSRYVRYHDSELQCLLYNIPEVDLESLITFQESGLVYKIGASKPIRKASDSLEFFIQPAGIYPVFEYVIGSIVETTSKKLPAFKRHDESTGDQPSIKWYKYTDDVDFARVNKAGAKVFVVQYGDLFGLHVVDSTEGYAEIHYGSKTRFITKDEYDVLLARSITVSGNTSPIALNTDTSYPPRMYVYDGVKAVHIKPTSFLYKNPKAKDATLIQPNITSYRVTKMPDSICTASEYATVELKDYDKSSNTSMLISRVIVTENTYNVLTGTTSAKGLGKEVMFKRTSYTIDTEVDIQVLAGCDDNSFDKLESFKDLSKETVRLNVGDELAVTPVWSHPGLFYVRFLSGTSAYDAKIGVIDTANKRLLGSRSTKNTESSEDDISKPASTDAATQQPPSLLNDDKHLVVNPAIVPVIGDESDYDEATFLKGRHDMLTDIMAELAEDQVFKDLNRHLETHKNLGRIRDFVDIESNKPMGKNNDDDSPVPVTPIAPIAPQQVKADTDVDLSMYGENLVNLASYNLAVRNEAVVSNTGNYVSAFDFLNDPSAPLPLSDRQVRDEMNHHKRTYFDAVDMGNPDGKLSMVPRFQTGEAAIKARAKMYEDALTKMFVHSLDDKQNTGDFPKVYIGRDKYISPVTVNTDLFGNNRRMWAIYRILNQDKATNGHYLQVIKYIGINAVILTEGINQAALAKLGFSNRVSSDSFKLVKDIVHLVEHPELSYSDRKVTKDSDKWIELCDGTKDDYDSERLAMARSIYYSGSSIQYNPKTGTVIPADKFKVFSLFTKTMGGMTMEAAVRPGNVIKFTPVIATPEFYRRNDAIQSQLYTPDEISMMKKNFADAKIDPNAYYVFLEFEDESVLNHDTGRYEYNAVYRLCNMHYIKLESDSNGVYVSKSDASDYVTLRMGSCLQFAETDDKPTDFSSTLQNIHSYADFKWYIKTGKNKTVVTTVSKATFIAEKDSVYGVYIFKANNENTYVVVFINDLHLAYIVSSDNMADLLSTSEPCYRYTGDDVITLGDNGVIEPDDIFSVDTKNDPKTVYIEGYEQPIPIQDQDKFNSINNNMTVVLDVKVDDLNDASTVSRRGRTLSRQRKIIAPMYIDQFVDVSAGNDLVRLSNTDPTSESTMTSHNKVYLNRAVFDHVNK